LLAVLSSRLTIKECGLPVHGRVVLFVLADQYGRSECR